jgi:hypothetical protein
MERIQKYFGDIYDDWWVHQVELGNIPPRSCETICRCHPNITRSIVFEDFISKLDPSYEYNEPKIYFRNIPKNTNKVDWLIDKLQDIYEDSIFGHQCMEDVNNIHALFWRKLNKNERQLIRDFIDSEPNIVDKEGDIVFRWIGGWKEFSLVMCAVFQKSFDHIEIN